MYGRLRSTTYQRAASFRRYELKGGARTELCPWHALDLPSKCLVTCIRYPFICLISASLNTHLDIPQSHGPFIASTCARCSSLGRAWTNTCCWIPFAGWVSRPFASCLTHLTSSLHRSHQTLRICLRTSSRRAQCSQPHLTPALDWKRLEARSCACQQRFLKMSFCFCERRGGTCNTDVHCHHCRSW
jgi:hypothetical protein